MLSLIDLSVLLGRVAHSELDIFAHWTARVERYLVLLLFHRTQYNSVPQHNLLAEYKYMKYDENAVLYHHHVCDFMAFADVFLCIFYPLC